MEVKADNHLVMTRGDSESFTVFFEEDAKTGETYSLEAGDMVYFTVKVNANTKNIILQKIVTEFPNPHEVEFFINPEDTKELNYSTFVYDVQITDKNGEVTTPIKHKKFTIDKEVTHD